MIGLRNLARPMMAGVFVAGGVDALRDPKPRAELSGDVSTRVAGAVGLPQDPETLVKLNGGVQVAAGVMLAMGWFPRLAAGALAVTVVPTTLAGHRFWEEENPDARRQQQVHFLKNLAVCGGLIVTALDTGSRPSVGWMAKRAAAKASDRLPGSS